MITASTAKEKSQAAEIRRQEIAEMKEKEERNAARKARRELPQKMLKSIDEEANKGYRSTKFYDRNHPTKDIKAALRILSKKPYGFKVEYLGEREEEIFDGICTQTVRFWEVSW